jgi:hypothetical protein
MIAAASLWIILSADPVETTVVYVTYTGTPGIRGASVGVSQGVAAAVAGWRALQQHLTL